MQVKNLLAELDGMVLKGQMVQAIENFFGDQVQTQEVDGSTTTNKANMLEKMQGFVGSIAKVNGINLLNSVAGDDVSMSEFTFDFDMKDGSKIQWHEVIRRKWQGGKVVDEVYFQN